MATTYTFLPPTGGGSDYWTDAVVDVAALPAAAVTGEIRHVLADHSLRYWDGAAWQVLTAGAAGTYVLKTGDTMSGNLGISTLTASRAMVTDGSKVLTSSATTATEIGYVSGVTSAIQTQINGKEASITVLPVAKGGTNSGTAIGGSKAIVSNGTQIVEHGTTTATEIGYVAGVTSAIQTQINGKQATGSYITALTSDVTASGPGSAAATVASVGGKTAAAVATSVTDTVAATSANTNSTIVKRDGSGNFAATAVTANLTGNVTGNVDGATVVGSTSGKFGASGAVTASTALEVSSTTGAFLLPRMTTTQRDALTAANGHMLYNTTTFKVQVRENGAWLDITGFGS